MTSRDKASLRRYLQAIRSWLPCSRKQKKHILSDIRSNIDAYLSDNPDADFSQVQGHFGSPQQIAASCVAEMDTAALLRALRLRRRVIAVVMTAVIAILLIWACGVTVAVIDAHTGMHGYITTT